MRKKEKAFSFDILVILNDSLVNALIIQYAKQFSDKLIQSFSIVIGIYMHGPKTTCVWSIKPYIDKKKSNISGHSGLKKKSQTFLCMLFDYKAPET